MLADKLREWVGVSGSALDCFASYLSGRSFSVPVSPYRSESTPLSCGVPQGLVFGLIPFALYILLFISKFKGISYHCYAVSYTVLSFDPDKTTNFSVLHGCLQLRTGWPTTSFSLL